MEPWVGPTVALSLALMALAAVGLAFMVLSALREARQRSEQLTAELGELRRELAPVMAALNEFADAGTDIAAITRDEIEQLVRTSKLVRREVVAGVEQTRERLADFDALMEVLHDEVEETALDVAVALRTVRTTRGLLGGIRRLLTRTTDDEEFDEEYEEEDEDEEEYEAEDEDEELEEDPDEEDEDDEDEEESGA